MTTIDIAAFADRLRLAIEREGLAVSTWKLSPYDNGGLHVEIDGDACLTNIGLWPNGCMDVESMLLASEQRTFDHRELASAEAAFDVFLQEIRNAIRRGSRGTRRSFVAP